MQKITEFAIAAVIVLGMAYLIISGVMTEIDRQSARDREDLYVDGMVPWAQSCSMDCHRVPLCGVKCHTK